MNKYKKKSSITPLQDPKTPLSSTEKKVKKGGCGCGKKKSTKTGR